jgi:hypothetical protein
MSTPIATKTDPRELRVILALVREGFTSEEICNYLHFLPATFYRRKAEIDRLERDAEKLMHSDLL